MGEELKELRPLLEQLREGQAEIKEGQARTDERLKVLAEAAEYNRTSIHSLREKVQEHQSRLGVIEIHVEECRTERQVAKEIHKVVNDNRSRIEKGETRDDLIDSRLLKLESSVETLAKVHQEHLLTMAEVKYTLTSLKTSYSGWKTFAITVGTAAVSALAGGYLTHLFGWGTTP